jgi:hypothetical protein
LHGTDWVQDVQIRVGNDVRRHGQWKEKAAIEQPPAWKVEGCDKPGQAGTDDDRHASDSDEQDCRVYERRQQYKGDQMRPELG